MARGRPPKNKEENSVKTKKEKIKCFNCDKEYLETNFYRTNSRFYKNAGKLPYCKQCIEEFYQYYFNKYTNAGELYPEKKAIKRLCMAFDVYYVDKVCNTAIQKSKDTVNDSSTMGHYMRIIQLQQYNNKKETYDNTISEEEKENFSNYISEISDSRKIDEHVIEFFGIGFNDEDYEFLDREYQDWTARHECNTKAQEEVFKRICFKQLEILKATRRGEDTKNLDDTFQKLLDTAKLQPKQNSGDTTADNQTFGTLIDKWENTRPLPEIDEELRDVDNIAKYVDIFYRGHLSKMMGLKNGLSNLYTKFMKKYTVEKPEYSDEENSEVLFDAIFGNTTFESDKDDKVVV